MAGEEGAGQLLQGVRLALLPHTLNMGGQWAALGTRIQCLAMVPGGKAIGQGKG